MNRLSFGIHFTWKWMSRSLGSNQQVPIAWQLSYQYWVPIYLNWCLNCYTDLRRDKVKNEKSYLPNNNCQQEKKIIIISIVRTHGSKFIWFRRYSPLRNFTTNFFLWMEEKLCLQQSETHHMLIHLSVVLSQAGCSQSCHPKMLI